MTDEERYQIKGALIKCAKENENKPTFTGHIVVSSLCKSAVERITELEKENAELDCQMNRNKYCHSCASATERCFGNEIGCPCEKYKSYKDENTKLKEENKFLKEQCLILTDGNVCNSTCSELKKQLIKAKEIIKDYMTIVKGNHTTVCGVPEENRTINVLQLNEEAEQFLRGVVEMTDEEMAEEYANEWQEPLIEVEE